MIDELPKTEWLRSFEAFASTLSFTHAAERLHLSQPALHAQVARLAEVAGVRLYRREGRRLELTPAGERLAVTARDVLAHLTSELDAARGCDRDRPTTLIAGEGALLYLLGPTLAAFRDHAERRLQLTLGDRAAALDAVRQGQRDVAVTVLTAPPEDLESQLLAEVGYRLVRRAGAGREDAGEVDVASLAGEPLVAPPRRSPFREALEDAAAAAGAALTVVVEARSWPVTLKCVALGLGAAVVNELVALPGDLAGRALTGLAPVRYYALRRPGGFVSAGAEELWTLLASAETRAR